VSVLHAELSENSDDIGFLSETDPGTIAAYFDDEELACRAEVRYLVFLSEFRFDLNRSFGGGLRISHGDIVNLQKYQNAVTGKIEVGIRKGLSEPKRE